VEARILSGLSGNERFVSDSALEVTEVPDGFVIYDEPRDKIHYLNATAAVVYTLCDGNKTVSEIGAFLRDAYAVETAPDLDALFADFEKSGLVSRVS
jgi:hypothetical protein